MKRPLIRSAALACLVVVGCSAAACGVPVGGPQAIQVPAVLLQGPPEHVHEQTTPPCLVHHTCFYFDIFLIQGTHLIGVLRPGTASYNDLLTQLELGPRPSEAGLTTAIPAGAVATIVKVKGKVVQPHGVVTVNLGLSFGDLPPIGFAQIVYTIITQLPGAKSVLFEEDGSQIETPVGNGSLALDPVTTADYAQFAPTLATPPTTPTTTTPSCTGTSCKS
jgi:hypothetical protein